MTIVERPIGITRIPVVAASPDGLLVPIGLHWAGGVAA